MARETHTPEPKQASTLALVTKYVLFEMGSVVVDRFFTLKLPFLGSNVVWIAPRGAATYVSVVVVGALFVDDLGNLDRINFHGYIAQPGLKEKFC